VTGTFIVLIAGQPATHSGSSSVHGGIMLGTASTVLA
jgi:uncharacterized Zn-binding protein involved in type VI secretion